MIELLGRLALARLVLRAASHGPAGARIERTEARLGDPRLLAFARGLSLGALLGAAIAGSTLWARLRRRGR